MIGDRLKKLRESTGLDQRKFSKTIKISASYVCQIEKNKKIPSPRVFLLIKSVYGVDLLGEQGPEESDRVSGAGSIYIADGITARIVTMLGDLDEETRRDVLRYTEDKKLLKELRSKQRKRG
jgi:transcriptional regulator with XRE-family HTH domain